MSFSVVNIGDGARVLNVVHEIRAIVRSAMISSGSIIGIVVVAEFIGASKNRSHQIQNSTNNGGNSTQDHQRHGQSRKASLARPMWVGQRFVAERLHALAHRFESVNHGWQCTPVHSGVRKCLGGAL